MLNAQTNIAATFNERSTPVNLDTVDEKSFPAIMQTPQNIHNPGLEDAPQRSIY
jgi:hypothetical protein